MRKVLLVIVLLITTIALTGCITFAESFQAYEDVEQISSIEVYYFDKQYSPEWEEMDPSIQPIKIIEQDSYLQVINDLEQLTFDDVVPLFMPTDPSFEVYRFVIKINFKSGVYQLVSNFGAVYTLDASGCCLDRFHGSVDDEVWNGLITKYIGEDLFNQYNQDQTKFHRC